MGRQYALDNHHRTRYRPPSVAVKIPILNVKLTYAAIAGSALGVRVLRSRFKEIRTKRKEQKTKIQKEIPMLEKIVKDLETQGIRYRHSAEILSRMLI